MAKQIAIEVTADGKIKTDYAGFEGEACFQEANQLQSALAGLGVDTEVLHVDPKKNELELRKLENTQKVGR